MGTRERLHRLVEELSDEEAVDTFKYAVARHECDERPGDIVDEWGNLSAMTRRAGEEVMRRLNEQEIAEHGETISETFARVEAERERGQ